MLVQTSMRNLVHFRVHSFFSQPLTWKIFLIVGILMRLLYGFYNSLKSENLFITVDRSIFHDFIWWLSYPLRVWLGNESFWLLYFVHVVFILFSLFFIWGGYRLSQNFTDEKSVPNFVLSVFSVHFALTHMQPASELMSMFFIPAAFYFLTKNEIKKIDLFGSSLFFSLSTFFFLHNLIFVFVSWIYFLQFFIMGRRTMLNFLWYLFFFLVFISVWIALQLFVHHINLMELIGFHKTSFFMNYSFSWSPDHWLYFFVLFLIFVPPFSFFLLFSFWKGISKAPFLFWQFVVFFIALLFMQDINEAKLLPLFPLFIILTSLGLPNHVEKNWANPAVASFLIVNFVLFFINFLHNIGYLRL